MTSVSNDARIAEAYDEYRGHPLIAPLARELGSTGRAGRRASSP